MLKPLAASGQGLCPAELPNIQHRRILVHHHYILLHVRISQAYEPQRMMGKLT